MTANQLACSRHVERLRAMATSAWPCVPVRSLSVPVLTCMFTLLVLSQANIAFAQSAQLPAPPLRRPPRSVECPAAASARVANRATQARPMPNDPTMPSPEIRSLLDGEKTNANAAPNAPPPNPTIRLRARVIAKGKPGLAIIDDVGGSTITVRQGDEINVTAGAGSVPIVITKLTATDLQVEIGSRRQPLNLN